MIRRGVDDGLLHLTAEDTILDGRSIRVDGKTLIHFGSCSYLGLELDPRVKAAAIDAITRYGAHFSSSRAYVSVPLYSQLESLAERIFGAPVVITPTTTLGHFSALPVLLEPDDAVLIDHQAHHSLQLATQILVARGVHVESVRHNNLEHLTERIEALQDSKRHIWYIADGIYSMFGNLCPVDELVEMLDVYPKLHLYIDDAHGVSWCGKFGRGYALSRAAAQERLIVATTLGKCFGAGGSVLVLGTEEQRRFIRTVGGPMIFAGPVPPAILGAAIESARIHLSDELKTLQGELLERIRLCNRMLLERDLPLVADTEVPVRYVEVGPYETAQKLTKQMMDAGFYVNAAFFPAVPKGRAGLRFTITRHQNPEDIEAMVETMTHALMHREAPFATKLSAVQLQHETTIEAIDPVVWDACLGQRGTFDWRGMSLLEDVFANAAKPEDRWDFHYYVARDEDGEVLLATFFTEALWKDDMLAPAKVSADIEAQRGDDPFLMTSKVLAMGSLLTEGNHLFIRRKPGWKEAFEMLLDVVEEHADLNGCQGLVLRDLPATDKPLAEILQKRGYGRQSMPASFLIDIKWSNGNEFIEQLSPKSRRYQRRYVLPHQDKYSRMITSASELQASDELVARFYDLYSDVCQRNLGINTFPLPPETFSRMSADRDWEFVLLYVETAEEVTDHLAAAVACFKGWDQYVPMLIGLDYEFVENHGVYRQALSHIIERGRELGYQKIRLGMGADLEKRRFGAKPEYNCLYLRNVDES